MPRWLNLSASGDNPPGGTGVSRISPRSWHIGMRRSHDPRPFVARGGGQALWQVLIN